MSGLPVPDAKGATGQRSGARRHFGNAYKKEVTVADVNAARP
jgi:hypothetical protein